MFNLGYLLGLADRAKGESLFWDHRRHRAVKFLQDWGSTSSEELEDAGGPAVSDDKYICNFSVFQSIPDSLGPGAALPGGPDPPARPAAQRRFGRPSPTSPAIPTGRSTGSST